MGAASGARCFPAPGWAVRQVLNACYGKGRYLEMKNTTGLMAANPNENPTTALLLRRHPTHLLRCVARVRIAGVVGLGSGQHPPQVKGLRLLQVLGSRQATAVGSQARVVGGQATLGRQATRFPGAPPSWPPPPGATPASCARSVQPQSQP